MVNGVSVADIMLEFWKENRSAIEGVNNEAGSKGVPGAHTDATHKVRQAISSVNPYNPV